MLFIDLALVHLLANRINPLTHWCNSCQNINLYNSFWHTASKASKLCKKIMFITQHVKISCVEGPSKDYQMTNFQLPCELVWSKYLRNIFKKYFPINDCFYFYFLEDSVKSSKNSTFISVSQEKVTENFEVQYKLAVVLHFIYVYSE